MRKLSLFIILPLFASYVNAMSQDTVVFDIFSQNIGGFRYLVHEGCASLVGTDSTLSGSITIPSEILSEDGQIVTVTSIESRAFNHLNGLVKVVVPTTVSRIENEAFNGCVNLDSIIVEGIVSMGNNPFHNCDKFNGNNYSRSMRSEVIIGGNFLKRMILFQKVYHIPSGVHTIFSNALTDECSIDTLYVPDGVREIRGKSLRVVRKVFLPESLETLYATAFTSPTLTSLELPSGVNNLVIQDLDRSYVRPEFKRMSVSVENPYYDSRNNCNAIIDTKTNTLVLGCSTTVIPGTVTSIGDMSFYNCRNMVSINIPESVRSIGCYAYSGCRELQNVSLPQSLDSIKSGAFEGCWNITTMNIPESLVSLGDNALNGVGISRITLPSNLREIGRYALSGTGVERIEIPSGVIKIGQGALSGCRQLKSIDVEKGNRCYKSQKHKSLVEISTKTLIASVGNRVPSKIEVIGDGAFMFNSNITDLEIPAGVLRIGEGAFQGCGNLRNISIPASTTQICDLAFALCRNLTNVVNYSKTPQKICPDTFAEYGTLHVPTGCRQAYQSAEYWNRFNIVDDL